MSRLSGSGARASRAVGTTVVAYIAKLHITVAAVGMTIAGYFPAHLASAVTANPVRSGAVGTIGAVERICAIFQIIAVIICAVVTDFIRQ